MNESLDALVSRATVAQTWRKETRAREKEAVFVKNRGRGTGEREKRLQLNTEFSEERHNEPSAPPDTRITSPIQITGKY